MLQYSNKAITMVDVIHLIPIPKTNVHVHPSAVTHPEQLVECHRSATHGAKQ